MDLELIGKQMLEALAVQGQLAGLEAKLVELDGLLSKAAKDTEDSIKEKEHNVAAREQAEVQVRETARNVETAKSSVIAAQSHLKFAEKVFKEAGQEVAKYDNATLSQLDEVTKKFEEFKKKLEADKGDLLEELKETKKDLERRQAVLAEQGIELNIGGKPQAKTTYL